MGDNETSQPTNLAREWCLHLRPSKLASLSERLLRPTYSTHKSWRRNTIQQNTYHKRQYAFIKYDVLSSPNLHANSYRSSLFAGALTPYEIIHLLTLPLLLPTFPRILGPRRVEGDLPLSALSSWVKNFHPSIVIRSTWPKEIIIFFIFPEIG